MPQRSCGGCGKPYEAKRPSSKFCSDLCRQRAHRKGFTTPEAPVSESPADDMELLTMTAAELESLGLLDSRLGSQILTVARQLGNPFDTGSSTSALSKELDRLFDKAHASVHVKADPIDQLRDRRRAKHSA
jgi:hypothetical protein